MRGTWKVEEFKVLGNPQAPLLNGKQAKEYDVKPGEDHWTKLFFENPGLVMVEMDNGKIIRLMHFTKHGPGHILNTRPDYCKNSFKTKMQRVSI